MSLSADELEGVFYEAVKAGDAKGVEASLLLLCRVDPHRAERLHDALALALKAVRRP